MTRHPMTEETFTMEAQGHSFRVTVTREAAQRWAWRAIASDGWKLLSGVAEPIETMEEALGRVRQDVRYLAQECARRGE